VTTTPAIAGAALPAGTITIRRWEDDVLRGMVHATLDEPREPHPLWALSGAMRGLGTDVDGILALAGATAREGPMVASCEIEYLQALRFDVEYAVSGRVAGLERKVGRRTGPFDLYTFALSLCDGEQTATRVRFVWVLPRRDQHGA
jgi:hypothetical protein